MLARATMILLTVAAVGFDSPASARPAKHRPARMSAIDMASRAVQPNRATRLEDMRARRWSLETPPPHYDDGVNGGGVQVRWRLNKVKLRAPIDFGPY